MPENDINLYSTEDGFSEFNLRKFDCQIRLTQLEIASLYQTSKQNVSLRVKNILLEGELSDEATVKDHLTVQNEDDREVRSKPIEKTSKNLGLLEKGGSGPATYYSLTQNAGELLANASDSSPNTGEFGPNASDLEANTSDLEANTSEFTPELLQRAAELSPKARKIALWPVLLGLCAQRPVTAEQLASLTQRKVVHLKNSHLSPLRRQHALLRYLYPEVENHPNQAYVTTEKGKAWLKKGSLEK